jgi:predicted transcriptional regulator
VRDTSLLNKSKKYLKSLNDKEKITMKLTEKSMEVYNYIKENGGRVSIDELAAGLNRTARSVNANVTDLAKKELAIRDKVKGEGEDAKDITYVVLTEAGMNFVPSEDAE